MMRKIFAASLLILAASLVLNAQEHTAAASAAASDSWITFTSEDGRFSVLLPEVPKDSAETTKSEHGPYTTHLFVVKTAKSVFLVGWVDYDPSFNFNVKSELDANRDNFVNGLKATLRTSNTLTRNGYPSLDFTADTADSIYQSRVFIIGRRPYQLVVGTARGQDDSANIAKFFESFKIVSPM